jgi:hypothetical protein
MSLYIKGNPPAHVSLAVSLWDRTEGGSLTVQVIFIWASHTQSCRRKKGQDMEAQI